MTMADTIAVMRAGRIEQLGAPSDLYDRPATPFVANFLGQSNLLPIVVDGQIGGLVKALAHEHTFLVRPDQLPSGALEGLQLGIRPEKLRLVSSNDRTLTNRMDGVVSDVSFTGVATTYLVRMPWGQEITVTQPNDGSNRAKLGEQVTLGWDPHHSFVVRAD